MDIFNHQRTTYYRQNNTKDVVISTYTELPQLIQVKNDATNDADEQPVWADT
jgi:hypothetical protein